MAILISKFATSNRFAQSKCYFRGDMFVLPSGWVEHVSIVFGVHLVLCTRPSRTTSFVTYKNANIYFLFLSFDLFRLTQEDRTQCDYIEISNFKEYWVPVFNCCSSLLEFRLLFFRVRPSFSFLVGRAGGDLLVQVQEVLGCPHIFETLQRFGRGRSRVHHPHQPRKLIRRP